MATAGQYERANVVVPNVCPATAADLGLRRDQIFEVWISGRGLDLRGRWHASGASACASMPWMVKRHRPAGDARLRASGGATAGTHGKRETVGLNRGLAGTIVTGSKTDPVRDDRPTLAEADVHRGGAV